MFGIKNLLTGAVFGGATVYTALNYHVIRTEDGVQLVSRAVRPPFRNTYVDLRDWQPRDWKNAPDVAEALVKGGHTDLLSPPLQNASEGLGLPSPFTKATNSSYRNQDSGGDAPPAQTSSLPGVRSDSSQAAVFSVSSPSLGVTTNGTASQTQTRAGSGSNELPIVFDEGSSDTSHSESLKTDRNDNSPPPSNVGAGNIDPFLGRAGSSATPGAAKTTQPPPTVLSLDSINSQARDRANPPGTNPSTSGANGYPLANARPARPSFANDPRPVSPFKDFMSRFVPQAPGTAAARPMPPRIDLGRPSVKAPAWD